MPDDRTVRTMCPMNCHPTLCGMQVNIRDGALAGIAGDPDNPDSRGFLCLRGRVAGEIFDNPARIVQPLIRATRGGHGWRQVSWDAALDYVAERLRALPPEALGIWLGHGDSATNYGTRIGGALSRRFAHLYGCQWWHPAMVCWALGGFGLGLTGVLDVHTKEDLGANADLILLWGANIASQPNTAPHLKAARRRGARVVLIDVRTSEAAARADDVVRLRPGTDAALALALMHVIVRDGLTDEDFLAAHSVGFDALAAHLERHDPSWAAALTGVSAARIEALAHDYAGTRRAMIVLGGSSMHKSAHGWQAARAVACLPALTGKLGIPGGGLGPRHGAAASGQGLNNILPDTPAACTDPVPNQMSAMTEALVEGRVQALLLSGTDMVSSFADSNRLAQGLARTKLIVCHDLFSNDTIRRYADVVLPGTAWLEQLGCKMTNTHLYLMEQALAAPAETCNLSRILRDLAGRLGVDGFFPWASDEQLIDALIEHPSTDHATVAKLRADAGIRAVRMSHHAYPTHHYSTPSGKVEFVSERAAALGLPALPVFTPPTPPPSWPLAFRQGRTLTHFHGFYDHGQALPSLRKHGGQPTLWMSPEDAGARRISDGDPIRLSNERGECRAHAHVTDKIGAGSVWMRDGWAGINRLTSGTPCLPDAAVDLFAFGAGQAAYEAWIEVSRV